jgi:hypothetical protein
MPRARVRRSEGAFLIRSQLLLASAVPMDDLEQAALRRKLVELKTEHRDLDDVIARLSERQPFDQIQLQRLKKRKLHLKDLIAQIENQLLPDIIA